MEHVVLTEGNYSEIQHVKGMTQKNVAEKVSHQKVQRQIDKQKRAFVKQHSKDENELKLILQRLQLEQQIRDAEVDDLSDENGVEESTSETSEDEGIVNPYPVTIIPKFGVTSPRQDKSKEKGFKYPIKGMRRKSLEYEDVDKIKSATSGMRTTLIAASFISKLRSPFHKRTSDQNEDDKTWCAQWETTASIRRPRKTVAEQYQHKLLQRAKTEMVIRPGSSLSLSSARTDKRDGSVRNSSKKDDTINLNDLQFEGTVEDGHFSPRGITKSRRGGSLKERKVGTVTDEVAKMRRCSSTKERRKKNLLHTKDSNSSETMPADGHEPVSRKNSKEKSSKIKSNEGCTLQHTSRDSKSKKGNSFENVNPSEEKDTEKSKFKDRHNRNGSLKERGEEKSVKKKRFAGFQKIVSAATRKQIKKQNSLSTDSSPLGSPTSSPTWKDKQFEF